MPKLNSFKVKIETGGQGTSGPVLFSINRHNVPFENVTGTTDAGEVFEGEYAINSFAHSLTLVGPEKGQWDIKKISVEFVCENIKPYSVTYGEVSLNEASQVNLWQDPPQPVFDV